MGSYNPWTKAEKALAVAKAAMVAADRYFNSNTFQSSEGTAREGACIAKLKRLQREAKAKAEDANEAAQQLKRHANLLVMDAEALPRIVDRYGVGMWGSYAEEFATFQKRERR